jgi:eukaryotic-like serine/threonine-protein kinase
LVSLVPIFDFRTNDKIVFSKLFPSAANVVEWRQLSNARTFATNRSRICRGQMTDDVTGARKGDYLILGTLGAGGMGKVYKVRNTLSDRIEAMKVLLPDLSDQKDLADRFLREIKVLASLHHPNIAELRTALTIENQLVMIMEYVEGSTLASRLLQGPVRYADSLAYFDQVLAALSCAHALKIVHRDIKPANIMLTPQGVVKLMDFGIARSGNDLGLTMTGTTLGSVAYMSPEQVRCEPIDGRSDLYSVGVSLYETITGQRPYVSDNNFEIMQAHLQTPPTAPIELKPDIPVALSELILMAMAKDPAQRFQTADALRAALMSVAPSFGAPSLVPTTWRDSTLDMTAPPTPRPIAPAAPRSVTARPVTARPITAQPVAIPRTPSSPAERAVDLPLASAGRGIFPPSSTPAPTVPLAPPPDAQASPQYAAAGAAPAHAGNRRGLYIALSALVVFIALIATGVAVMRLIRPPDHTTSVPASSEPAQSDTQSVPDADAGAAALKALPCQPSDSRCWSKLPDGTPGKLSALAAIKPHTAVQPSVQNPSMQAQGMPQQSVPQQQTAPQPQQPAQQDPRAAEQAARETADKVAQLAALEREELDEVSSDAKAVSLRVAALQKLQEAQGQQPRSDVAASQQRMQHDIALAESALRKADVQNAQNYMDQANSEIAKLKKFLGQ